MVPLKYIHSLVPLKTDHFQLWFLYKSEMCNSLRCRLWVTGLFSISSKVTIAYFQVAENIQGLSELKTFSLKPCEYLPHPWSDIAIFAWRTTRDCACSPLKTFVVIERERRYISLACLSVCLYPIRVKTAEPIGAQIFCGTSRDHREGLWMITN